MSIWDDFKEAAEDVGDGIKAGAEATGQAAEDAWNEVTGAGEDAANAEGKTAEDFWNGFTQLVEDAVDMATNAAADAGEWGIGAFETVGSGIGKGLEWLGNEIGEPITSWVTDTLSDYGKEIGLSYAGSFIGSLFGGSGENKEQGPVADGSDIGGPYTGGESDVGTVGQALSTGDDDSSSVDAFGDFADAIHDAPSGPQVPDLSNILTTLDEARSHTGFAGAALADAGDGGSSVGSLLGPSADGIGMPQENGIVDAFRDLFKGLNGAHLPMDVTSTLDEARASTSFSGVAVAEGDTAGAANSIASLPSQVEDQTGSLLGEEARPFGALGDASDAGIIVVGGHDPGEVLPDASPVVSAPIASFADSQFVFADSVHSEPTFAFADIASEFSAADSHVSFA